VVVGTILLAGTLHWTLFARFTYRGPLRCVDAVTDPNAAGVTVGAGVATPQSGAAGGPARLSPFDEVRYQ
jgi:hypothetical protein